METGIGNLSEFRLLHPGVVLPVFTCPPKLIPHPGQYILAYNPNDPDAPLAEALFQSDATSSTFTAAVPAPRTWHLGDTVHLRGPFGKGFHLPAVRHLALIAMGSTIARLLPLIAQTAQLGGDIALFTEAPLSILPPEVEIHPLQAVPDILSLGQPPNWADFLAIDCPASALPNLRAILGLPPYQNAPVPGQILIDIPMPCAGIGDCGVCAVPIRGGNSLVCKSGPVLNLNAVLSRVQS